MFIYESLHVTVVKVISHIDLQVFLLSTALSNYLGDSVSYLASTFILKRYDSCILAQHVNDDENLTFVEM